MRHPSVSARPLCHAHQAGSEPDGRELRDDECATGPHCRQRFAQSRACAVCAGQAMVDVDVLVVDAERSEHVALSGEVLGVGGDTDVTDEHARDCSV